MTVGIYRGIAYRHGRHPFILWYSTLLRMSVIFNFINYRQTLPRPKSHWKNKFQLIPNFQFFPFCFIKNRFRSIYEHKKKFKIGLFDLKWCAYKVIVISYIRLCLPQRTTLKSDLNSLIYSSNNFSSYWLINCYCQVR